MANPEAGPIRLPKQVEADPRGASLAQALASHSEPLWAGSELTVPVARLTAEVAAVLSSAYSAGRLIRGLEKASAKLDAEQRGLNAVDAREALRDSSEARTRGVRVSRLLLLSNDGAERFYRQVEALLRRHAERAVAIRLDVDASELGGVAFGPRADARLLLLGHKDAVGQMLLALATQWESPHG